jgi:hypothetical protein
LKAVGAVVILGGGTVFAIYKLSKWFFLYFLQLSHTS